MLLPFNAKIWLYLTPVDFRRQIDGLVLLISGHLHQDPTNGQLFLFRNKGRDKIKILYWQDNGFWLFYKRLERGRFKFPGIEDNCTELSRDQLQWLLSGLEIRQQTTLKKLKFSNFC